MKRKTSILKKLGLGLLVLTLCFLGYGSLSVYGSKNFLETTTYTYESDKIRTPVSIAMLSDMHAHAFGENNKTLVKELKEMKRDAILLVGDIINFYEESSTFLCDVITQIKDIAPVYYTIGNHEMSYMMKNEDSLQDDVEKAGAVYLDQNYVDVTLKGEKIRLGGLYDYAYNYDNVPNEQYLEKSSYQFLKTFEDTSAFKLMLSHRPESFLNNQEGAQWNIDLVVSGHEHGGQIRLPVLGGFYSTHLGLMSPYLDNYHIVNGIPMIISRGLGTHTNNVPPRWDNIPEIVNIQLQ